MGKKRRKKSKKQEGNERKSALVEQVQEGNESKSGSVKQVQDTERKSALSEEEQGTALKNELTGDEPTDTKGSPEESNGTLWTLGEFLDQPVVEPDPLLAPWLKAGDQWMVHAKAGIGKTFFSLNVAWAVACGGKYLGWKAPEARKVLYVDGEMDRYDMFSRMQGIVGAARRDKAGDVEAGLLNFQGFQATYQDQGNTFPDLATHEGLEILQEHAEGMALVVIDNLSTTMRTGDENESAYWMNMQDTLVELRKQGTAVLLVHHSNKSGDQRGTSMRDVILNGKINLDTFKYLEDTKEGAQFVIKWEKARGLKGSQTKSVFTFLSEDKDGLPVWGTVYEPERAADFVELVKSKQYRTQVEIGEVMGVGKTRVHQLKEAAIQHGMISEEQMRACFKAARGNV